MKNLFIFSLIIMTLTTCKNTERGETKYINYNEPLEKLLEERGADKSCLRIFISKSTYTLSLLCQQDTLKSYPIVLGPDPVNDKLREGDGCTPEGEFAIRDMYPHARWTYFIWIDYPNQESKKKHKQAKDEGKIPADVSIGGEIGIHGVPEGQDGLIDRGENWTLGCISLKTADITEIYQHVSRKTPVTIVR